MKPILVIRHAETEGAGFFGDFLDQHQIDWVMVCIDRGQTLPDDITAYRGLVMMGGPMSVNDDLPWIKDELSLIQQAFAANIPILGHCLGGQLISKALGSIVGPNPAKEIGWGLVKGLSQQALDLFGIGSFEAFHWHGETFDLPKDARLLLSSQYCKNQAYQIGKAIAFQCHIEMTEEMVKVWCKTGAAELASNVSVPSVQTSEQMQSNLALRVANLNQVATNVYSKWIDMLD